MKLKIPVVDFDIPRRAKLLALRLGAPIILLTVAAVAFAEVPHKFAAGQVMKSAELNANFDGIDARLSNLEGAGSRANLFAAQNKSVSTVGDGNWIDVPGLTSGSFLTTEKTSIDLQAIVDVTAQNVQTPAAAASTNCALRFVIDATPTDPVAGVQVNSAFTAIPFLASLVALERVTLDAGTHKVSVQITKPAGAYANTACAAGSATFSPRGRLRVQVN